MHQQQHFTLCTPLIKIAKIGENLQKKITYSAVVHCVIIDKFWILPKGRQNFGTWW
jgi:hypothetical protein